MLELKQTEPNEEVNNVEYKVGVVGISGFGGGEALRLIANHPFFRLVYASGDTTSGRSLSEIYPGINLSEYDLVIEKFCAENLPELDILFVSLPTGTSSAKLKNLSKKIKIVDIGGDHRYSEGWTYGLADIWPEAIKNKSRIANPGCFPTASIIALAPLLNSRFIQSENIIIDAKTGLSGAGRGSINSGFSYAATNENLTYYGLSKHTHIPEIKESIERLSGNRSEGLVLIPHLVPMTRGIAITAYCRGNATSYDCIKCAKNYYSSNEFVRVMDSPLQTKWASGSNLAFVNYVSDPKENLIIAMCVIDNLGKGAAGTAIQNANLMCGLEATTGLLSVPMWP